MVLRLGSEYLRMGPEGILVSQPVFADPKSKKSQGNWLSQVLDSIQSTIIRNRCTNAFYTCIFMHLGIPWQRGKL